MNVTEMRREYPAGTRGGVGRSRSGERPQFSRWQSSSAGRGGLAYGGEGVLIIVTSQSRRRH